MTKQTESSEPIASATSGKSPIKGLRVSVLVPTYNRANYLSECLDSLLSQTMPALEIIVIDDGSEDGSADILKGYGPRIRYIRKENGGKPTAVNLGLSLAQGELIWIFDDDDVALPTAIESRVQVLQERPDAGFVYSPHYYGTDGPDGKIQQGRLNVIPSPTADSFFFELMKGCFFHLATSLVRAEAYQAVGGFDTELLSSEDYDMQLRLARVFPAAYCPKPSFIFRQHSGLRGAKAIRYAGNQRSKIFRRFDQRVGQKLRSTLTLGEFLIPRSYHPALEEQHLALCNRAAVMASKGCLPELFDDFRDLMDCWPVDPLLASAASQSIASTICTGYAPEAIDNDWNLFKVLLADLHDLRAKRVVLRSIARGLFLLAKGYPAPLPIRWRRLKHAGFVALYSAVLKGHKA